MRGAPAFPTLAIETIGLGSGLGIGLGLGWLGLGIAGVGITGVGIAVCMVYCIETAIYHQAFFTI